MEVTGSIKSINTDYITNDLLITLAINEKSVFRLEYEKLKDHEKLIIKISKFFKKRSRDANRYSWSLMSKMAAVLKTSDNEVYERMLQLYGTNVSDEEENTVIITVKSKLDISKLHIHCSYIGSGSVGEKEFDHYRLIKGSSEYNTQEMSRFINGVVEECKELDIETLPPDELERMKSQWGTKHEKVI